MWDWQTVAMISVCFFISRLMYDVALLIGLFVMRLIGGKSRAQT